MNHPRFLIRPTRSLAKKMGVSPGTPAPGAPAPGVPLLHEWYCNDFRFGRTDLALFLNPETCISLVLKAAPYKDLVERFLDEVPGYLVELGVSGFAGSPESEVQFAKTEDKSVIGIMVQFIKELDVEDQIGRLSPVQLTEMRNRMASTLVSSRGFKRPLELLAEETRQVVRSPKPGLRLVT